ncbi:TauD/TfdA family dioxygenase [Ramlibacter sp.]|uniref:TauD/TfdA family dioxygenase n=1 Tax=Ramlibacter sp. TaxID=1917967 RepID=UPI00180695E5|nr:TauD/TfdA family dioxygenase [Ramlibacter sp.]MBA2674418.1 TauD/TfdA family dioxygenase [Ramlibacter sp.]
MEPFLSLSDADKQSLVSALLDLSTSPYRDYPAFRDEIAELAASPRIPDSLARACESIRTARTNGGACDYLLRNCPLDPVIPVFDQDDPVADKYRQKTTFVGEGFLALFAKLTETPLLAYSTRNNGDFFHDVYAQNRYTKTQTQKTDGELYFHNDRTAHPVRADYLALLGMRADPRNLVYTGYVDGRNILEYLSQEQQAVLREPLYCTPYDEYSRDSNQLHVQSKPHTILEEAQCFRYYDTRTKPMPNAPMEARDAVIALKDAIVRADKVRVRIGEGDLFSFPNQAGLHNRDIVELGDPAQAKLRWLLKTYSFRSDAYMRRFDDAFSTGVDGFVYDEVESAYAA